MARDDYKILRDEKFGFINPYVFIPISTTSKSKAEVVDENDLRERAKAAKAEGDSVGGQIRCTVTGLRPGLGGVDFAALVSALNDIRYTGYACIEVEDKAFEGSLEDTKEGIERSYRYMRNLM